MSPSIVFHLGALRVLVLALAVAALAVAAKRSRAVDVLHSEANFSHMFGEPSMATLLKKDDDDDATWGESEVRTLSEEDSWDASSWHQDDMLRRSEQISTAEGTSMDPLKLDTDSHIRARSFCPGSAVAVGVLGAFGLLNAVPRAAMLISL